MGIPEDLCRRERRSLLNNKKGLGLVTDCATKKYIGTYNCNVYADIAVQGRFAGGGDGGMHGGACGYCGKTGTFELLTYLLRFFAVLHAVCQLDFFDQLTQPVCVSE